MISKKDKPFFVLGIVLVGILIIVFVVVIVSILVLKLMPDSIGALYIQDIVETIQKKLGLSA